MRPHESFKVVSALEYPRMDQVIIFRCKCPFPMNIIEGFIYLHLIFFSSVFQSKRLTVYYSVLVNSLARESDRGWWVQHRGSERLHHVKRSDGELSCNNNIASAGTPSNCVKVYRKLLTQFVR